MTLHLPILCVITPLIAALFCAVIQREIWAWLIALIGAFGSFLVALLLLFKMSDGPLSYAIGGWAPPIGIEYRIDSLSAYILVLVSAIGCLSIIYAYKGMGKLSRRNRSWYFTMLLLCLAGLLGMVATGDAFNLFVFMEIASLSSYVLIALGPQRQALVAAYRYLIMGTIGATSYIIGIGFLYAVTGTLNIADLALRLIAIKTTTPVLAGLTFLIVGLSLKAAIFPLHTWLPSAYAYAPASTSAFLSGTATKVAIYCLLRFLFTVFGVKFFIETFGLSEMLMAFSLAAILVGSITALYQKTLRRMLAYSSIAQVGYITLGFALANENGLTGALVQIAAHGLMKVTLFFIAGSLLLRIGSDRISDFVGLGRRMPWTFGAFTFLSLSLFGAPGTIGFLGKWLIAVTAVEQGAWWLVAFILITSLFTIGYMGRIIETAYSPQKKINSPKDSIPDLPWSMGISIIVLTGICLWFGVVTDPIIHNAHKAAQLLLGEAL